MLKYKYIIISYGYDYYDYVYRQFDNSTYATFSKEINFPFFPRKAYNLLVSRLKMSSFREWWTLLYVYYIDKCIEKVASRNDHICIIMLAGGKNNDLLDYGLTELLRKKYKKIKIVYFINDLIDKTKQPVELMKEKADLVISFDPSDAKKYSILNHIIPYSNFDFNLEKEEYDVAFVGAAKDRLEELISIHRYLIDNGIKSYFQIINVPKEKQISIPGVVYSGFITYKENLQILSKSRCIVDIVQKNGTGNTIRVGEAIIMGKKLLTNNVHTPTNGVYDEKYMHVFTDCTDINLDFIRDPASPNYTIKESMYPINLLYFIEESLHNE